MSQKTAAVGAGVLPAAPARTQEGNQALSFLNYALLRTIHSLRCLQRTIEWCQEMQVDVAIVRATSRYPYVAAILGCMIAGVTPILYTQAPAMSRTVSSTKGVALAVVGRLIGAQVMTPSLFRYSELSSRGRWKSRRKVYIPFAVPPTQSSKPSLVGSLSIAVVADFVPRKRIVQTLDAIRRAVTPEVVNYVKIIVVGETRRDQHWYFEEVRQEVDLLLKQKIPCRLVVGASHRDTQDVLREADLFILASEREPASVSQLEAMANGCAIAIGADNGTAHYVVEGENGIHLTGDVHEWVAKLRYLMHNREVLARMGAASIQRSRHHHHPQQVAKMILSLAFKSHRSEHCGVSESLIELAGETTQVMGCCRGGACGCG